MKLKDIKIKSDVELEKQLAVTREKLRELRFKDANKQMKNVKNIDKQKKIIARILTVSKQREIQEANKLKNKENK